MTLAACLAHLPASVNDARDVEQVRISKASPADIVERPVCTSIMILLGLEGAALTCYHLAMHAIDAGLAVKRQCHKD